MKAHNDRHDGKGSQAHAILCHVLPSRLEGIVSRRERMPAGKAPPEGCAAAQATETLPRTRSWPLSTGGSTLPAHMPCPACQVDLISKECGLRHRGTASGAFSMQSDAVS